MLFDIAVSDDDPFFQLVDVFSMERERGVVGKADRFDKWLVCLQHIEI